MANINERPTYTINESNHYQLDANVFNGLILKTTYHKTMADYLYQVLKPFGATQVSVIKRLDNSIGVELQAFDQTFSHIVETRDLMSTKLSDLAETLKQYLIVQPQESQEEPETDTQTD